jgi:hypothetical protein
LGVGGGGGGAGLAYIVLSVFVRRVCTSGLYLCICIFAFVLTCMKVPVCVAMRECAWVGCVQN